MNASSDRSARLYVDPVSPYAYFYLKQLHRLPNDLELEVVPVLFGSDRNRQQAHPDLSPLRLGGRAARYRILDAAPPSVQSLESPAPAGCAG